MRRILIILLFPFLAQGQTFIAPSFPPTGIKGNYSGTPGFVVSNVIQLIDPDVITWATAAGITNGAVILAYSNFVTGWKTGGYWTNTKFIHPYTTDVGSGAPALAQMKFNLKDPRDLDVAYRLTPSGGGTPTYTSAGYLNGGAGCWLQTFAKPNPTFSNKDAITLIIGISTNVFEFSYDIGAADFTSDNINLFFRVSNNNSEGSVNTNTIPTMTTPAAPNSDALWYITRTGSAAEALYKNNSSTPAQTSTAASIALGPNQQIVIGALGTSGTAVNPSNKTYVIDIGYNASITGTDVVIMGNLINQLEKDVEVALGLSTGTRSWF